MESWGQTRIKEGEEGEEKGGGGYWLSEYGPTFTFYSKHVFSLTFTIGWDDLGSAAQNDF